MAWRRKMLNFLRKAIDSSIPPSYSEGVFGEHLPKFDVVRRIRPVSLEILRPTDVAVLALSVVEECMLLRHG
jgi:hypothetical protein